MNYKDFNYSSLIDKSSPKLFSESPSLNPLTNTHFITAEKIDKVLEDETITTKAVGTHKYLDRYKRKTPTVDSQLDRGVL